MSYKYGDYSGDRNDRFFVDMMENSVNEIFKEFLDLSRDEEEINTDARVEREEMVNEYYIKMRTPIK